MIRSVLLVLIFVPSIALAEEQGPEGAPPFARNAIYLEGLGNGLTGTLNYDRMLTERFSIRVGVGVYIADSGAYPNNHSFVVPLVPLMLHYLMFEGSHKMEFGAGVVMQLQTAACQFYSPPVSCTAVKPTLLIGYRYQAHGGGFVFRGGFTPVIYGGGVYWGMGMSLGGAF